MLTAHDAEMGTEQSYTPGGPIADDSTRSTDDALLPESGVTTEGQILLDAFGML